jgi:hypothetical protein
MEKGNKEMCKFTKGRKSFLVLGLLLFGLLGAAPASSALDVGDKAPEFTLPSGVLAGAEQARMDCGKEYRH